MRLDVTKALVLSCGPISRFLRSETFIITGKSKRKNDYSNCLAAFKYHSDLIMLSARYHDEFIKYVVMAIMFWLLVAVQKVSSWMTVQVFPLRMQ